MTILVTLPLTGGRYLHWGVLSVSVANLLIILGMVVVFVLALLVPFPHQGGDRDDPDGGR